MEFETDPEALRDAFLSVMTKGAKNNTYKFALARFLLDYCHNPSAETNVRYVEIAEHFFDYYWVQECKSRLLQGPSNQPPLVIQIIKKKFSKKYYPQSLKKIRRKEQKAVRECVLEITEKCFDDVIPRFEEDAEKYFGKQRRTPSHKRIFYHYLAREYRDSADNKKIDPGGGIVLNPSVIGFLNSNYETLFRTVVLEWLRFLEKRNIGMPRLAEKISNGTLGPRDQSKFRKYLKKFSDGCFYCGVALGEGRCTHVDHVIPYDYVGATDLWNLVLACRVCNCEKSGRLPPESYIAKLNDRNRQYRGQYAKLGDSLSMLGDELDISWHYENAAKHGYPPWKGPD